jgi:O-antigen/teichoic acid export membrane protein
MVFWKRLYCDFSFKFVKASTVKSMLKYSVPMIPTAIFWWITSVSNRFVVKEVCGDDVNGLFAAAYKIPTVITLLTTIFIEAWHFSAVNDADNNDRGSFFSTVFKSYMGIIFMAASGLIAFSKICTIILFADSYYDAWQYMPTLILATTFSALTTFMGSVYLVKKKSVMSFLTAMTGAVVNLALSFVLIPRIGAHGAALAAAASYFVSFALRTFTAQKFVRFDFHPEKLAINTALVGVQAWIMIAELPHWIVYQALLLTAVLIFNGKPILDGIWLALKKYRTQKS